MSNIANTASFEKIINVRELENIKSNQYFFQIPLNSGMIPKYVRIFLKSREFQKNRVARKLAFLNENLKQNITFDYHIISHYLYYIIYLL